MVGSLVGIALIAGALYFALRRRKRNQWNNPSPFDGLSQYEKTGAQGQAYEKPELGGTPARHELDPTVSSSEPKELTGSNSGPYEVEGSDAGKRGPL